MNDEDRIDELAKAIIFTIDVNAMTPWQILTALERAFVFVMAGMEADERKDVAKQLRKHTGKLVGMADAIANQIPSLN
jgi:hypothetical protein